VRVHELAAASGLPVPDVQVGPHEHERRWLRRFRGTGRLVVSLDVAGAGPAEQDWALASALAHRSSRPARSRAWLGTGLVVGAPSVELVWRVLAAFDALDGLPYRKAVGIALVFVCLAMGHAGAAAFRSSTRAADAAAVDILIAAGRDPVSITRQVFRDTTRFAWWAYVWRPEPTDQSRIAAAERRGGRPAPALH